MTSIIIGILLILIVFLIVTLMWVHDKVKKAQYCVRSAEYWYNGQQAIDKTKAAILDKLLKDLME